MRKMCEPFPPNWCRNVDFLPTMFLQSELNKNRELYFFKGHVSVGETETVQPIVTDLGVAIKPSSSFRDRIDISFGSEVTDIDNVVTVAEIWNDFKGEMPDRPDIVIKQWGIVHKVPENVMDIDPFDGADYIFQQQSAIGNRHRSFYKKTGIRVVSSYSIAKEGLYNHGVVKPNDPCLKRIKSTLATDFLIPSNNKGYYSFQNILLDVERGLRGKTFGRVTGLRWWEDTAIPKIIRGNYDHTAIDIRVCQLDDKGYLIGV